MKFLFFFSATLFFASHSSQAKPDLPAPKPLAKLLPKAEAELIRTCSVYHQDPDRYSLFIESKVLEHPHLQAFKNKVETEKSDLSKMKVNNHRDLRIMLIDCFFPSVSALQNIPHPEKIPLHIQTHEDLSALRRMTHLYIAAELSTACRAQAAVQQGIINLTSLDWIKAVHHLLHSITSNIYLVAACLSHLTYLFLPETAEDDSEELRSLLKEIRTKIIESTYARGAIKRIDAFLKTPLQQH